MRLDPAKSGHELARVRAPRDPFEAAAIHPLHRRHAPTAVNGSSNANAQRPSRHVPKIEKSVPVATMSRLVRGVSRSSDEDEDGVGEYLAENPAAE
jgi:hypothetical protein